MIRLRVDIDLAAAGWKKAFPQLRGKIAAAVSCAFLNARKPQAFRRRAFTVNVVLGNDAQARTLNRAYRGKDKPTNVLSFPQLNLRRFRRAALDIFPRNSEVPLGDVVLAWQTVQRESRAQRKSLEGHVMHLVVHGTLHLLGYDHEQRQDAKIMEKLECDILAALGYPDPYNGSRFKKTRR